MARVIFHLDTDAFYASVEQRDRPEPKGLPVIVGEVAAKLRRERLAARTVQVKVRYGDFRTLTRQACVEEPVESAAELYRIACAVLRRSRLIDRPVRLLGLGASGLGPPSGQRLFRFIEERGPSGAAFTGAG